MNEAIIALVIAEDSTPFRSGLRALLKTAPDMKVVGEAVDGAQAVALALDLQPDVILMDLQMPTLNGIEATRQVMQSCPHIAILMLTMFEDDESVFAAMRAGARGYLLKGALRNEILAAVRAAAAGEAIFGPALAKRMMHYFAQMKPSTAISRVPFPELTERECEVLQLIAQGRNNTEIAEQLVLSAKTVRNYISTIFDKLQVSDRAQAILRARGWGKAE
jgi:DNA-binding NarL/FixJ family response regulator